MRAVDTNVLARFYLRDDGKQTLAADRLFAEGNLFVPKTVLLELEWVLRSVAEQPATQVMKCLTHLASFPGITLEDAATVDIALDYWQHGLDFADALHLASSRTCDEFLTFDDRGFAARAARFRAHPPVTIAR